MTTGHGQTEVRQTATCKYCGDAQVAWVQARSGKWYLVQAALSGGVVIALRVQPHRCQQRGVAV